MDLFLVILAAAGGYVASIYTWPKIRTIVLGVEAEANALRQRAAALMAAVKKI